MHNTIVRLMAVCALAALATTVPVSAQQGPPPGANGPPRFPMTMPADPRTTEKSYVFAPTGEEMKYTLYVSSKVKPGVPAPLIVALHGMGGDSKFIARDRLIDLAEEGGYVVVAPMGYNTIGWFGSPVIVLGGGEPKPANLTELSELDVMTVTEIAKSQFNIDPNRVYLMGHSMGGAGTLFLGQKHADYWAAIAAIAPAAFMMQPVQKDILAPLKAAKVPVMITEGSADNVVPPETVRTWAAAAKDMGMESEYVEVEGKDHGTIIGASMPDIFRFFAAHKRTPPPPPRLPPARRSAAPASGEVARPGRNLALPAALAARGRAGRAASSLYLRQAKCGKLPMAMFRICSLLSPVGY